MRKVESLEKQSRRLEPAVSVNLHDKGSVLSFGQMKRTFSVPAL